MAGCNNLGLFDDIAALPPPPPDLVTLGSRIPASIKLGTSTWTYDGWTGDVYHRAYRGAQPARRLEEYARYPLFRVVGIDAPDARTLRQKFAANPAVLFPIPIRYEMDIHEVRLNSGSGLLLQNGSKIGDLALVWSTADHIYFLTGGLTEAQVIELANSIQ